MAKSKSSGRGLEATGKKMMGMTGMDRHGPASKNVVRGGRNIASPIGNVNSKMKTGKLRGPGVDGC